MAPNVAGAPGDLLPSMASSAPVLRAAEDALYDLNRQLWASKAAWSPQRAALTKALTKARADAFGWRKCMLAYEAELHSTWGPQLFGLPDTDWVYLRRPPPRPCLAAPARPPLSHRICYATPPT